MTIQPNRLNGCILQARKILVSDIWKKPPIYLKVWTYLLHMAQFKDNGNLKRGQLFTSIDEIREECSYMVGFRKEKPSRKQIWGVLEWLRKPHGGLMEVTTEVPMIVTMKVTHGMIITISNYNTYQDLKTYEGNNEGNDEGMMKERCREQEGNNINKKVNKEKKEKKDIYRQFKHLSITETEYKKLVEKYPTLNVDDILDDVENYAGNKKYTSLYLTANKWLKKRLDEQKPKEKSPYDHFKVL